MEKRRGLSYQKRVMEINRIYDSKCRSGLSNREIWRRYIYPVYAISERTFYNMLKASADEGKALPKHSFTQLVFNFGEIEAPLPPGGGIEEIEAPLPPGGGYR